MSFGQPTPGTDTDPTKPKQPDKSLGDLFGDLSSEFIVAAATIIETEMCATAASDVVFPHPTVSQALREAILEVR